MGAQLSRRVSANPQFGENVGRRLVWIQGGGSGYAVHVLFGGAAPRIYISVLMKGGSFFVRHPQMSC